MSPFPVQDLPIELRLRILEFVDDVDVLMNAVSLVPPFTEAFKSQHGGPIVVRCVLRNIIVKDHDAVEEVLQAYLCISLSGHLVERGGRELKDTISRAFIQFKDAHVSIGQAAEVVRFHKMLRELVGCIHIHIAYSCHDKRLADSFEQMRLQRDETTRLVEGLCRWGMYARIFGDYFKLHHQFDQNEYVLQFFNGFSLWGLVRVVDIFLILRKLLTAGMELGTKLSSPLNNVAEGFTNTILQCSLNLRSMMLSAASDRSTTSTWPATGGVMCLTASTTCWPSV
jgi:hypothetical protein